MASGCKRLYKRRIRFRMNRVPPFSVINQTKQLQKRRKSQRKYVIFLDILIKILLNIYDVRRLRQKRTVSLISTGGTS